MNRQPPKLNQRDKIVLRSELYFRDGARCHYCGIEESDFPRVWGKTFYGGVKRGGLEIDRRDNDQNYDLENCVLACPICNMAKSDKITHDEFIAIGDVIKKIWQQRKTSGTRKDRQ